MSEARTKVSQTAPCIEVAAMDVAQAGQYGIYFGQDVLQERLPRLIAGRRALVVTSPTVFELYSDYLLNASGGLLTQNDFLILDVSEETKDFSQVAKVCDRSVSQLDRAGLVIGFGGGVVTDITAFAASIIRRGVAHAKIPTTLIGHVDAAIGIKGGINFAGKKSYLGCFRAPDEVLIDPVFLKTLPTDQLSCGLAEIIKMALIGDAALFALLAEVSEQLLASAFSEPAGMAEDIIVRAICLMIEELRPNITETLGTARTVDFGHTFSPTLEAALAFELPHGFAVAIDMALSAAIAERRGTVSEKQFMEVVSCIRGAGLPVCHENLTPALCAQSIVDAQKHRSGHTNLILPVGIGSVQVVRHAADIDMQDVEAAIDRVRAIEQDC